MRNPFSIEGKKEDGPVQEGHQVQHTQDGQDVPVNLGHELALGGTGEGRNGVELGLGIALFFFGLVGNVSWRRSVLSPSNDSKERERNKEKPERTIGSHEPTGLNMTAAGSSVTSQTGHRGCYLPSLYTKRQPTGPPVTKAKAGWEDEDEEERREEKREGAMSGCSLAMAHAECC